VILVKGEILTRLRAATARAGKLAAAVSLWVVAAGSKVVVLELVAAVFGDAVSLGGFISVSLLVVALLASRGAVRRLLEPEVELHRGFGGDVDEAADAWSGHAEVGPGEGE
jgi:hypothetical protein